MLMKKLYNGDGTLSTEAQLLLAGRPAGMSFNRWRKLSKDFTSQLRSEDLKEYKRLRAKQYSLKWYGENTEESLYRSKKWRTNNPEKAKWHALNPEKAKENDTRWRAENIEHRREWKKEYERTRRAKDPLYRFQCNMRSMGNRIVRQLSLGKKPTNTFNWIGCSAEELKNYLESLFTEGMNWENYGAWHVDHIRPVCSFSAEEWEQINHYTNLQPLWAKDNLLKGDSW